MMKVRSLSRGEVETGKEEIDDQGGGDGETKMKVMRRPEWG